MTDRRVPSGSAFAAVSLATVTVSVVVGVPAPLNPLYAEAYGVTPAVFTGAFAVYVVCAAVSMLTCGRLSDQLGRRAVGISALGFSLCSCVAFLFVAGPGAYVAGRVLAGFGVGLGMPALGAFVVDLAPARLRRTAALVTSAAAPLGTAAGAIGSGVLVQFAPHPLTLGFVVAGALVVLCTAGVWLSPETVPHGRERVSLVPVVGVPRRLRTMFVGSCLCFVGCWSLGGLYQSLGATIAADALAVRGGLVGGAVSAAVIGTTVVGGAVTSLIPTIRALAAGVASFVLGVAGVALGLRIGHPGVFVAASMLAGVGFGAAFNACMRTLLDAADPRETAGVLSASYLVGFLGSALPNVLAGLAVERLGLSDVVALYGLGTGLLVLAGGAVVGRQGLRRAEGTQLGSGA